MYARNPLVRSAIWRCLLSFLVWMLLGMAASGQSRVWAWGSDLDKRVPVSVLTDVVAIADGNFHNLAVKPDGTV